jgi:SAM-dependent methyltransferase
MEETEYKKLYEAEQGHWWFRSLHEFIVDIVKKQKENLGRDMRVLDVGCGTGRLIKKLTEELGIRVYGVDISRYAAKYCSKREINTMQIASACALPYKDASFDMVISVDVLGSLSKEQEKKALDEFYRILNTNGKLFLHLPAYQFLYSAHDIAVSNRRRVDSRELQKVLIRSNFNPEKLNYRLMFLFPLIFIYRKLFRNIRKGKLGSDVSSPFGMINAVLYTVMYLEKFLLRNFNLPFGVSVFCLAGK